MIWVRVGEDDEGLSGTPAGLDLYFLVLQGERLVFLNRETVSCYP